MRRNLWTDIYHCLILSSTLPCIKLFSCFFLINRIDDLDLFIFKLPWIKSFNLHDTRLQNAGNLSLPFLLGLVSLFIYPRLEFRGFTFTEIIIISHEQVIFIQIRVGHDVHFLSRASIVKGRTRKRILKDLRTLIILVYCGFPTDCTARQIGAILSLSARFSFDIE